MSIRLLNKQDTKLLKGFLSPHKTQCMFICGNLNVAGIEYKDAKFHGEYLGYFSDTSERIKGIIVHSWNGNVMMFAPDTEILRGLVTHLKGVIKRPIAGILGPNNQAAFVIRELGLSGKTFDINNNKKLYEINLDFLNEPNLPLSFKVVKAKEISRDLLEKWMQDYEIEALGSKKNSDLTKRAEIEADGLIKNTDCWILIKDNIPVSLCSCNARVDDMLQIGPVWTPPEHRNQGFSKFLLAHVLAKVKREGVIKAVLFTDNPAAIKVYESIGFKIIGEYRLAILENNVLYNPKFKLNS
ncbi:MAG: GNAT family N-acetyltransferase [Pseudomonadota bacterium]